MNPLKRLASQTLSYGFSSIVGRLLNYFLVPLYTYHFSTSQYGLVTEMYTYVSFLIIILTYGMETALFNFSNKEENKDKVYGTALISVSITSVIFMISIWLLKQPIADVIKHSQQSLYVFWFGLIIGTDAITAIAFAELRRLNKVKTFVIIRLLNIVINIGFNLFFIVLCPKVITDPDSAFYSLVKAVYNPETAVGYVFISNLIASLFTLVLLLPYLVKIKLTFDRQLWKRMMMYALPLLLAGLAGQTNEAIDRLLIKYILPFPESENMLGIYGACYKISIIMTMFIQTFRYAAEPFFFSHAKEGNAKTLYAIVMKYFVIICCIIFLGTVFNLSWIQYFVGKDFREGLKIVPILLLANFFLGVFYNLSMWYKLTGKTLYGSYLTLIGASITLLFNFLLIPFLGYMGAAWATLICYAVMMIISYFWGQKHYPIDYKALTILGYFTLSLLLYGIIQVIPFNGTVLPTITGNLLLLLFIGWVYVKEKEELKTLIQNKNA